MKTINAMAPNQYTYSEGSARIFQSYESIICKSENGITYLDEKYYNYSKTTSKYRNQFLGCDTKECEKRIKSGKYKLVNLN